MSKRAVIIRLGALGLGVALAVFVTILVVAETRSRRFINAVRHMEAATPEDRVIDLLGQPYQPSGGVRLLRMNQQFLPRSLQCPSDDYKDLIYYIDRPFSEKWTIRVQLYRKDTKSTYILWSAYILRGRAIPDDLEILMTAAKQGL